MIITNNTNTPGGAKYASVMRLLLVLIIASILAAGCSFGSSGRSSDPSKGAKYKGPRGTKPYSIRGKTYYPLLSAHGFSEDGIASWYGRDFHGKQTANGERYDMYGMTAAHKLLPFGTQVRVTNKTNGRSIVVRINDRGPFVDNRVIDLTKTAADKLGMLGPGTAPVALQTLGTVPGIKNGDMQGKFYVQVGAFGSQANAEGLKSKMIGQGTTARTVFDTNKSMWIVQAGPYPSLDKATTTASNLKGQFPHSFVAAE